MREEPRAGRSRWGRRVAASCTFVLLAGLCFATRDVHAAGPVGPAEAVANERKHDCVATSESAQQLRLDGKLVEAQQKLTECAASSCPEAVRADCATWLAQVNAIMPSVVLSAQDAAGEDVGDVTVTLDGKPFASKLDGKAIPVGPGEHVFHFERGGTSVDKKVIVHEGEAWRKIAVTLAVTAPAITTPSDEPKKSTGPGVLPWIVVGVGGATVVAGAVMFFAVAPNVPVGCSGGTCKNYFDNGTPNNTPNTDPSLWTSPSTPLDCATHNTLNGCSQSAKNRQRQNDAGNADGFHSLGLLTMGIGGVIVAGGLVYYFLASPKASAEKSASVQLLPIFSPTMNGAALGGSF